MQVPGIKDEEINKKLLAPDGIIAINRDKKIIVFNEAAARLTGCTQDEVVSRESDLLCNNSFADNLLLLQSLSTGEIFSNISLKRNRKDKEEVNVTASVTPLMQPSQGIIGIIIVFRDTQETLALYKALDEKN